MKKNLILLFIIGLGLILFERVGFFSKFENILGSVTHPVQLSFYAASHSITDQFSILFDIGNLHQKSDSLAQKVALLEAENGKLKKLEVENSLLRDQLGLSKDFQGKLIGANVLGYTPALTRGFITLDRGTSSGIKNSQTVVLKDILIGLTNEVKEKSTTVRLLSDPESKVLAETGKHAKGIVIGDFGSKIKLTKVLLEDHLEKDDLVYSSGDENFPKGLVIGKISKVNRLESELFQEAEISPMIDLGKLDMVFVRQ